MIHSVSQRLLFLTVAKILYIWYFGVEKFSFGVLFLDFCSEIPFSLPILNDLRPVGS